MKSTNNNNLLKMCKFLPDKIAISQPFGLGFDPRPVHMKKHLLGEVNPLNEFQLPRGN
jgi:hypothetical protein